MKTYKLEKYGETYEIALAKGTYASNGTLAILMYLVENGEITELWNDLTTNIPMSSAHDNFAYIDTNNNGKDIVEWLEKNKIGKDTLSTASSGWCVYPLFKFDKKVLAEMEDIENI